MRALFHPEFPKDIRRFEADYARVSIGLAKRFRDEVDQAVDAVKYSPTSAGHFLNIGSLIVPHLRRRNLQAFPFFVLYGLTSDKIIFGSVIPSRSDPLTWLARFPAKDPPGPSFS
jgi:hypothetical protein